MSFGRPCHRICSVSVFHGCRMSPQLIERPLLERPTVYDFYCARCPNCDCERRHHAPAGDEVGAGRCMVDSCICMGFGSRMPRLEGLSPESGRLSPFGYFVIAWLAVVGALIVGTASIYMGPPKLPVLHQVERGR